MVELGLAGRNNCLRRLDVPAFEQGQREDLLDPTSRQRIGHQASMQTQDVGLLKAAKDGATDDRRKEPETVDVDNVC